MQSLTAVVLGATGFIGQQLVQQLLNDAAFSKVRILVRRPVEISHPKLQIELVDFNNLQDYRQKLGKGDCLFCCVGTTQKQVKGDHTAYRHVDFDIPVNAAKLGKDAGFTKYLLVSSVGANASSGSFYLQLKGAVENEIAQFSYSSFHVFRPGILLGERKEFRVGEAIGKLLIKVVQPLLAGSFKKYRGVQGADLAKAMVAAAKLPVAGMVIHHYSDIKALAKS